MVTFNFETFEVRLDRLDGMVGTATLPRPEGYEPGPLREMSFSPSLHFMSFTTVQGDDVHVEMPKFGDAEQLAGRVVVYLDQCIWRRISDAHHAPVSGAEDAERAAARRLIELVDRRAVVLPLSAGHHHEVTAWSNDEQRYLLGLAMLRVSRGWQMRDPLTLRREEYRAAFYRQMRAVPLVAAAEAFTLLPNVTVREPSPAEVPADFDAEATHVMQTLGYFQAIVSTILDSRPIPASTQRLGWVDANQQLSDWLVTETGRTSAQKRKSVDVVLLNDLSQELAEEAHQVGMLPSQLKGWLVKQAFAVMDAMPSVGLYRGVLQDRHLNVGTRWTGNDLTDMLYLSAAAGCADVVVAERHMTSVLSQAQRRLGRPRTVWSSLREAVPAVEELVVKRWQ